MRVCTLSDDAHTGSVNMFAKISTWLLMHHRWMCETNRPYILFAQFINICVYLDFGLCYPLCTFCYLVVSKMTVDHQIKLAVSVNRFEVAPLLNS